MKTVSFSAIKQFLHILYVWNARTFYFVDHYVRVVPLLWWQSTRWNATKNSTFLRTLEPLDFVQPPPLIWQPYGHVEWSGALPGSLMPSPPGTFTTGGTSSYHAVPFVLPTLSSGCLSMNSDTSSCSLLPLVVLAFFGLGIGLFRPFLGLRPRPFWTSTTEQKVSLLSPSVAAAPANSASSVVCAPAASTSSSVGDTPTASTSSSVGDTPTASTSSSVGCVPAASSLSRLSSFSSFFSSSLSPHSYPPSSPTIPRPKSQKDFPRSTSSAKIHPADVGHKFTFTQ